MTATISRGGVSPLTPINATLSAMHARYGDVSHQGLTPGLIADPSDGGHPAAALLKPDGMADFLAAARLRWDAQPHAAAALAWKCYSYWVALPAVLGFAGSRRVPLMTPDRVRVHHRAGKPFVRIDLADPVTAVLATDPIATTDAPGMLVVADEDELLAVLRRSLMDEHLAPMADAVQTQVHLGHHTLWGSVASGVAYGLSRAADLLPGSQLDTAHTLLATLDAENLVDLSPRADGGLTIRRRTCCLAFTLPAPKICTTCCLRTT